MKNKRERYLVVFVLTTVIFAVGIFVGSAITTVRVEDLKKQLNTNILDRQSFELELALIRELGDVPICNYIDYRLPEIIKNKVELGRKFDVGDIPEENADALKKEYSIFLINFLLLTEIEERECDLKQPKILFFYNEGELSRVQARALDYIVYRLSDENIRIFSFNVEWNEPLIEIMETAYNVTEVPIMVIKDEKYVGFHSKEEIEAIICKDYDLEICND